MRRVYRERKIGLIIIGVVAFLALFTFIVMSLWNAILPAVLHVSTITFWQALGILVLSKILFGGFHGGGGWRHKRQQWREKMSQKWDTMTPEEREKFKQHLKNRCGPWRNRFTEEKPATPGEAGTE